MVFVKSTQVNVGETVAIDNQDRVGAKLWARQTYGAGGAERPRLDNGLDRDRFRRALRKMLGDRFGAVTECQHHTARTEARQPVEQIVEIDATGDRREQLGRVAQDLPYARPEPAGKHQHINGIQTRLCLARAHRWNVPVSAVIRRRAGDCKHEPDDHARLQCATSAGKNRKRIAADELGGATGRQVASAHAGALCDGFVAGEQRRNPWCG